MAKLGILAGGGALPARLIRRYEVSAKPYFVLAFDGHTDPETVAGAPHAWVRLGAIGSSIELLRAEGVTELVMIGAIRRPSLAELRPDAWTARFFALNGASILGDDGMAKALRRALEAEGFALRGIDELLDSAVATAGPLGQQHPDAVAEADIIRGFAVIDALGALDIGQAAVIQGGVVLGVEAIEGTDALIDRCAALQQVGHRPVLVKASKPGQERRIDLPTIGPVTVERAAAGGFAGIAVEAGRALIVDRDRVRELADTLGLFVVAHDRVAPPLIYLIAGEPSGDMLGASLMAALRAQTKGAVRFAGIGGREMTREGLDSLIPITGLAIMGVLEVIPSALRILDWVKRAAADIERTKPAAVVTIDSSGFCFRVAGRLRRKPKPPLIIHYVAPMVWAWRANRAHHAAAAADHLMTLLPFEPPYFEKVGLPATFVGHPVIERPLGDAHAFRARHAIAPEAVIVAVLPGSRGAEVRRLLPVFVAAMREVAARVPDLVIVLPTVETVEATVAEQAAGFPGRVIIVTDQSDKRDAFAAATAAIAASGTVSLELAVAGVPMIIAYILAPWTAWVLKRTLKVSSVTLVNLLLRRNVIPELLQEQATPERIAAALLRLLTEADARHEQRAAFAAALEMLRPEEGSPATKAAATILALIAERRQVRSDSGI